MVKCERGWKVTFWEKKWQSFLATSFWERPNRPCSEREIFLSLQSRAHSTDKRPPGNISRARARALLLSSSGVDDPFRLFLLLFLFWNTTFNLNFFFNNFLDHWLFFLTHSGYGYPSSGGPSATPGGPLPTRAPPVWLIWYSFFFFLGGGIFLNF